MASATDDTLRALSAAWERIRREDSRVPNVVLDLRPGRSSSCSSVRWETSPVVVLDLVNGDRKLTGAEVLLFLLHQAAHAAAGVSPGSEGRWHSRGFRQAAKDLGLAAEEGPAGTGWSKLSLTEEARARYQPEIQALDQAAATWEPVAARKHGRGPVSLTCSCTPPRVVRVSSGIAAAGGIDCAICRQPFRPAAR